MMGFLALTAFLFCFDSPYNDVKSFISLSQMLEGVGEFLNFYVEVRFF